MSTCWYCGDEIEFRYVDGQRSPIHKNGGWCKGYSGNNDSGEVVYTGVVRVNSGRWVPENSFSDTCRKTECPQCGQEVFFIRHNGGSLWVDALGWPWPKHPCMDNTEEPSWHKYFYNHLPVERHENIFVGVVVDTRWQSANEQEPSQIVMAIDGGEEGRVVLSVEGHTTADYFKGALVLVDFNENTVTASTHDVVRIVNLNVDPELVGKPHDWVT